MKLRLLLLTACLLSSAVAVYNCSDNDKVTYQFPRGFLWGAATASYQVEGGVKEGGRGPSIWDYFDKIPGKIAGGATGNVACDSYNKWEEDLDMLQEMGLNSYRFSFSWSRIFPDGLNSSLNPDGVAYYHKLIDGMRKRNIEPLATMYHWDLPSSLGDQGGWLNRDVVEWFTEYARFLYTEYGDKIKYWMTLNEPLSQTNFGYCATNVEHAPGGFQAHCNWAPYAAGYHMMLAHAEAYHLYHDIFYRSQGGFVSMANAESWVYPLNYGDTSTSDLVMDSTYWWFWDVAIKGDYPPLMRANIDKLSRKEGRSTSRLPVFTEEQKARLKGTADFIGINYYSSLVAIPVDFDTVGKSPLHPDNFAVVQPVPGAPPIPDGWIQIHPEGLYNFMKAAQTRYGNISMLITENGCMDAPGEGLNDSTRIYYMQQHLNAIGKALRDGIDVIGYSAWSLMDNFEWAGGYGTRFGMYHVDFDSDDRTRTAKASSKWFTSIAEGNVLLGC